LLLIPIATPGIAAPPQADADRGRAIFAERDRLDRGFVDQRVEIEMTLRSPGGRVSHRRVRLNQLEGPPAQGDKALLVFESPPDIEGTALLTHEALGAEDDSQWLYLPAYKRVKRIASRDRSGRFVGTEFSYEDLAGDKLEDFSYRYQGEENLDGRRMLRVQRIPLNPSSEYSRQETWVDPKTSQVVRVLLYDKKGRHIKTLEASDWKRYEGRFWRPRTMVMTHVPSGRSTLLKASEYRFGTGLSDADFAPAALSRLR
jgi:outer membrane lipoprotein-sorting protein